MQLAPNSQEPETPAVPAGPGPARTRTQTRKSRTVEDVTQTEFLPTGDQADLVVRRSVEEVVKTVAVVRGRGGGVSSGSVPRVEEVSEGAEEGEGAPRRSGRRAAASARLEEELDEVMARGTGHRRAGTSPEAVVRSVRVEVTEEGEGAAGEEEEEEEEEEDVPEEGGGVGELFGMPEDEGEEVQEIEISEDEEMEDLGGGAGGGGAIEEKSVETEVVGSEPGEEEEEEVAGGPRTPGKLLRGVLGGHREGWEPQEAAPAPRAPPRRAAGKVKPVAPEPTPRATPRRAAGKMKPTAPASSAKKARGRGHGRGKKRPVETYKRYVYAVLKQVHPELGISTRAMEVMHAFMVDLFERLAETAGQLTSRVAHRRTLGAREVQTAARLVLPGTLADHTVEEGKRAVLRFEKAG